METRVLKSVLVVEDDPQVAYALSKRLSHAHFDVLWAPSGEDAMDFARSQQPAVITLDVRLPDIDGSEVALRLRQDPHTANIPIIFITGAEGGRFTDGPTAGKHCFFLRKPYDPGQLIRLIHELLSPEKSSEGPPTSPASRRQRGELAGMGERHWV